MKLAKSLFATVLAVSFGATNWASAREKDEARPSRPAPAPRPAPVPRPAPRPAPAPRPVPAPRPEPVRPTPPRPTTPRPERPTTPRPERPRPANPNGIHTEPIRGTDGRFTGSRRVDARGNVVSEHIVTRSSDGLTLRQSVSRQGNYRYTERETRINNTRVIERTTIRNNVTIVNNYNVYNYRGRPYYSYRSGFAAGFMTGLVIGSVTAAVLMDPWVPYRYAWVGYPYGGVVVAGCWGWCFAPRPYYYNAWEWTGDYVAYSYYRETQEEIAQLRQETARAEADAAQAREDAAEAKARADEISRQIAIQARQQADYVNRTGDSLPLVTENGGGVLNDMNYVFFVDEAKSVTDENSGDACDLNHGATLKLDRPLSSQSADQQNLVYFKVHTSRPGDCRPGTVVSMPLDDAQDFVNEFNSRVEQGIKATPQNVQVQRN